jgi:hypothetical protein
MPDDGAGRVLVPVHAFGSEGDQSRYFGGLIGGITGVQVEVESRPRRFWQVATWPELGF